MNDTIYSARPFNPAVEAGAESFWSSLFMATPLYIFATAVAAALQGGKR